MMSPVQHTAPPQIRNAAQPPPTAAGSLHGGDATRVLIQQATASPIPPTAIIEPASNTTASLATASTGTGQPASSGISTATKIGLGMIPVVVMSVGLYIVFLFWYRKQRAARKVTRKPISPPVPEKDHPSYCHSIDSTQRTSKVFQMAAFSTPIHDGRYREAQMFGERKSNDGSNKSKETKVSIGSAPLRSPSMAEADMDSPIDGSSPFRLRRGDTVKRSSLGPALAKLWPSPPPSVWIKPYADDELPSPVVRRESSVYQQRPLRRTN